MVHPPRSNEPIPGYVVKERIGVGGYGEVWSAQAPGGLIKAIKFVYGFFDDARAARELKALDRIKQVRHPFLLSLERYEVVDGQLIIVTELADMSLKDRYEQAKEAGNEGIPRDELLGYLRDAADALDYMSDNFALQHLDVKPENLLLVGGRVKVADFGLVKNLHEATAASMMGGLTPIYAAPEVFDDRPSGCSDQYSLAIVYQEMLCGSLPFPGRTPAQLAAQHLHASPRLATLPPADQQLIAQALAKNPIERFASSRALIDALVEADNTTCARPVPTQRAPARPVSPTSDTTSVTSLAGQTDTDSPRPRTESTKTQILDGEGDVEALPFTEAVQAAPAEPIAELPPVDVDTETGLRPTLYLGVGGTAAATLGRLRRRLTDRFGAAPIPSIRMLQIDTDVKSLLSATSGDSESALRDDETMALALRSARDYTANSRNMMQWLSRRWLYNIPRSLQTEGRRPLGRLALVDHAPQWVERLRDLLKEMTDPNAVAVSAERTGVEFSTGAPRVFVVASLSGGTGGGMALDLAYAVRQILSELGLATDGVCEILAHSTDRNPAAAELATANAYACLTELEHYSRFGYCRDEPACGLPPFDGQRRALSNAYFVHLGDGLNEQEFADATDVLASYVYLSSVTSAAGTFDKCRKLSDTEAGDTPLRSFSLRAVGCSDTALTPLAAELLARRVVDAWRGKSQPNPAARSSLVDIAMGRGAAPRPTTPSEMAPAAAQHAAQLELEVEALRGQVAELVTQELGGDAEAILRRLRTMIEDVNATSAARTRRLLSAIGDLFDPTAVSPETPKPPAVELYNTLEQAIKPIAAPKSQAIAEWILQFVDDPKARIAGALQAKDWYAGQLRDLEADCAQLLNDTQHNLQALEQTLAESEKSAPSRGRVFGARRAQKKHQDQVDGVLQLIIELRITECALNGVCQLLRLIASGVSAAGDRLKDLQRELGQLSHEFEAAPPWDEADAMPEGDQVQIAATRHLREQMQQMVCDVDARFQETYLLSNGGLRTVCDKGDALHDSLVDSLRAMARAEVLNALKQMTIDETVWGADASENDGSSWLEGCLDSAQAKFADCGGGQRLLAILPGGSSSLQASISKLVPSATVVTDADAEMVLCYEQQDLSLAHVAARLIDGRSDIIQIAGRLHTRMDVPWSKLPQVGRRPLAECAAT